MRSLRFGASTVVFLALAAVLVSCTPAPSAPPSSTPASTPSAASSASAEPVSVDPFTCDSVLPRDAAVIALTGSDGVAPDVVQAVQPTYAFDLALLTGAGGLACSWRAGVGQLSSGSEQGDWAYVTAEVLPYGASAWVAPFAGDTPSDQTRTIAGIRATTTVGESGWVISAPVGSAWLNVTVTSSGLITGTSRFSGAAFDRVLDNMMPAAEASFAAVQDATLEQLSAPALPFRTGEAHCDGGLAQAGIENAMQLGGGSVVYSLRDARVGAPYSLSDAVKARVGLFTCEMLAEGFGYTQIAVVRDFDSLMGSLSTLPDLAATLEPVSLAGAVPGETALQTRSTDGPASPLYFTLGTTLYEVYSERPQAVAEAIIAQTR